MSRSVSSDRKLDSRGVPRKESFFILFSPRNVELVIVIIICFHFITIYLSIRDTISAGGRSPRSSSSRPSSRINNLGLFNIIYYIMILLPSPLTNGIKIFGTVYVCDGPDGAKRPIEFISEWHQRRI